MSFWAHAAAEMKNHGAFKAHLEQQKAEADYRILLTVLRLTETKGIH
jgi:hypothetical protein